MSASSTANSTNGTTPLLTRLFDLPPPASVNVPPSESRSTTRDNPVTRSLNRVVTGITTPITAAVGTITQPVSSRLGTRRSTAAPSPAATAATTPTTVTSTTPVAVVTSGSSAAAPSSTVSVPSLFFNGNVQPVMSESVGYNNMSELVEAASIEHQLRNAGLTPIEKIVVSSTDGSGSVEYIKATTPDGHGAFIQLDQEGYVATTADDPTYVVATVTETPAAVTYSQKVGSIADVGLEITGVAHVCSNGVCVVTRTESLVPQETTFLRSNVAGDEAAALEGIPVSYPVVRLSEVVASPVDVVRSIGEAAARLRAKAYDIAVNDLKKIRESTKELNRALGDFERVQADALRDLRRSIDDLKIVMKKYDTAELIAGNRDKYDRLSYNLRRRYELLEELIICIQKVAGKHLRLDKITRKILDSAVFLRDEFKDVAYVINP